MNCPTATRLHIQWQWCASAGQPAALRPLAAAASALVSSGQLWLLCDAATGGAAAAAGGASGAGAFWPCPPVRAPSEAMPGVSPPGGSPPRDMNSFTLGTTSPPHALSATACAMDFNWRRGRHTVCTTHYDVPTAYYLRDGLELETTRRHVAPVACLARAQIGLDDGPSSLRRAAAKLELHLKKVRWGCRVDADGYSLAA